VGQATTRETVRYTVVTYTVALVLITVGGGAAIALGYRTLGVAFLVFGIWFTAFIGSVNIGWELFKYRATNRPAASAADDGPGRELAPDIRLAVDTKIGFVVTVLGLVVLVVSFELVSWLVGWG
jgi:hypothetical protein